ncbi:MAG: FHA domain-containing protein [bacterium]|nr:FHA domain-containing protein [bacterium]
MLRNAFSYIFSVLIGLGCGFFVMRYLKQEHFVQDSVCMIIMIVIIALFAAAGHFLSAGREIPVDTTEAPSKVAMPEFSYPADGIWGWIMPEESRIKSGYPLKKNRILIGRDVKCDIMLNDESLSRQHAEIIKTENGYRLSDMNSKNGVFVNNQRVSDHYLQNGDLIMLGSVNMTIKIVYPIIPPQPEIQQEYTTARLTNKLPEQNSGDNGRTSRF